MWCQRLVRRGALVVGVSLGLAFGAGVQAAPGDPYEVEVWADVLFGQDGKAVKVEIPDTEGQPAAFIDRLKRQLQAAKVQPRTTAEGQPATWQTGMRVVVLITPGPQGAQAKLQGISPGPRPIKRYSAPAPSDMPDNDVVNVTVQCRVKADGSCGDLKILESTGTSQGLRRWAQATVEGWRFDPQRLNGVPEEADVTLPFSIQADRSAPVEFRFPKRL